MGWWKKTNLAIHMAHTSAILSRHWLSGLSDENNVISAEQRQTSIDIHTTLKHAKYCHNANRETNSNSLVLYVREEHWWGSFFLKESTQLTLGCLMHQWERQRGSWWEGSRKDFWLHSSTHRKDELHQNVFHPSLDLRCLYVSSKSRIPFHSLWRNKCFTSDPCWPKTLRWDDLLLRLNWFCRLDSQWRQHRFRWLAVTETSTLQQASLFNQ